MKNQQARLYFLISWLPSLYSNLAARIYRLKGYMHFSSMVYDGRLVLLGAAVKHASWLRVGFKPVLQNELKFGQCVSWQHVFLGEAA